MILQAIQCDRCSRQEMWEWGNLPEDEGVRGTWINARTREVVELSDLEDEQFETHLCPMCILAGYEYCKECGEWYQGEECECQEADDGA